MRSLQARLVATTMVLLVVVCAVVGVGAAISLRHYLQQQLDQDVMRTIGFIADPPDDADGRRPPPPDAGGGFGGGDAPTSRIEVRSVDGRVVSASALGGFRSSGQGLPLAAVAPVLAVSPGDPGQRPETVDLPALESSYRLAARTTADGSVVHYGVSTGRMNETVGSLALYETIIFGGGVLVAGIVAAFATRATLRPLHRVSGTARKVAELPLERGEVRLEDRVPEADADPRTEVGQVGAALNRMLEHVARSLAARQDSETRVRRFVADASHELRTPLAAIRGYSELARRRMEATGDGHAEMPTEVGAMLERIGSQTERMTLLVEDLLLLARLDAGRPLAREPVDLARLVVDAVSDAHATSPGHRWSLDLPDPDEAPAGVTVTGDPERLHQVVANLLANARTHTPPGTNVVVGLSQVGHAVQLVVRDDGPGIAAELLPHVLERFARGDAARTRATGSTGLGLSIVSAVVTEHGGTVEVTSVPGDTRTTVTLPGAPARAAEPALRQT